MRLLASDLDSEFKRLLGARAVQRVDIATAWATDGPALDALERAAKRRKIGVRALVGVEGGHTTPTALKRLSKLGSVRLVDGGNRLFHVKLYLFHTRNTSFLWIGSANFTGRGFESNEEVLFETKDAEEAVDWFKSRWQEIDAAASRKRLRQYCENWEPPARPQRGVDDEDDDEAVPSDNNADDRIVFVQEGKRPPPRVEGRNNKRWPARGLVKVAGKSIQYTSAQEAVILVFEELQRRDEDFLPRCGEDVRFGGGKRRFVAPTEEGLGTKANRKHAVELENGWWMSTHTRTLDKWQLIEWGADVAGLQQVDVEGKRWQAEKSSSMEVGF